MILLLALGNGSRGDDGVGVALGRALAARLPPGAAHVEEAIQLLPEHAEAAARAEAVVFLDATVTGAPGEAHAHHVHSRAPREALLHALTPEEILGLTRSAYGKMPQGLLVTVAGKDFSFVERLSDEVQAAVPVAVEKALSWLAPYLAR
ncbi:MAG: hydrogenase maturation protease [Anaeromyxobacteraceae bacterium]|nr:hydrogenase maturation protease [Anaeromyxobacteraceae bacterium]